MWSDWMWPALVSLLLLAVGGLMIIIGRCGGRGLQAEAADSFTASPPSTPPRSPPRQPGGVNPPARVSTSVSPPTNRREGKAPEEELGDYYQRKRAASLAKAAKRKQTGDEAAVSEAEVDAQMGNAPRLPELTVSLDNFRKRKCKCLVYRKGGDCDCTLCMYVIANLRKFLVDIQRWHSVPGHGCTLECNDRSPAFVRSLASPPQPPGVPAHRQPLPEERHRVPAGPHEQRRL